VLCVPAISKEMKVAPESFAILGQAASA